MSNNNTAPPLPLFHPLAVHLLRRGHRPNLMSLVYLLMAVHTFDNAA
jgi:hypothetical protein